MRLVGLRTIYYGRDSHKNNLSDKLPGLWAAFVARAHEIPIEQQIEPSLYYGVIRQTAAESDQLEYHAAVEVSEACEPPEGMVETRIEAARYALFEHRGFPEQLDHTVNYVYSTWLMQSSLRHTYAPDLELYDKRYYRPGVEDSVVHYAIPVG